MKEALHSRISNGSQLNQKNSEELALIFQRMEEMGKNIKLTKQASGQNTIIVINGRTHQNGNSTAPTFQTSTMEHKMSSILFRTPSTFIVWTKTFFKISSFVFRRKKVRCGMTVIWGELSL